MNLKLAARMSAMILAVSLAFGILAVPASAANESGNSELPEFLRNDPSLNDKLPHQIIDEHVILLGDKDISPDYLREYYDYYVNTLKPYTAKMFPAFARSTERPVFIVTRTEESARNWTYSGLTKMAHGVYDGKYLLLMEHQNEQIGSINEILFAHEFFHWLVDKVYYARDSLSHAMNEAMAYIFSWMLYEGRDDWTASLTDRYWNEVANSDDPVPTYPIDDDVDKWAMTFVSYLGKTYGSDKMALYLEKVSKNRRPFRFTFGVTDVQAIKDYRAEIRRLRAQNGILAPETPEPREYLSEEVLPVTDFFDANNVGVILNGTYIDFMPSAVIRGGTTYIPLRGVLDYIADIDWTPAPAGPLKPDYAGIATIVKGDRVVKLYAGTNRASVNGRAITLNTPSFVSNGYTYVPLRFVSEALGATVRWSQEKFTAVIETDDEADWYYRS